MSTAKPAFKNIDFGGTAAAVDQFARQNGVPDLVFPDSKPEGKGGDVLEKETPAPATTPAPQVPRLSKPAPSAPIKRLAVELPEYLVKAVSDEAHNTGTTIRFVITHALKKAGFFVGAEDLKEDGRRGR